MSEVMTIRFYYRKSFYPSIRESFFNKESFVYPTTLLGEILERIEFDAGQKLNF